MLLFLPITLCCSALIMYLLCSILCSRTGTVVRLSCFLYAILYELFTTCSTVILECINERYQSIRNVLSYDDCSIRVYQWFTTIFHKCLILVLIFILHFPIMLALWLMLLMTHYAQNYAGIISWSLLTNDAIMASAPHW